MSKYKAGDTVYVKCEVMEASDGGGYKVKHWGNPFNDCSVRYIYAYKDNVSDISADEAWEIAKKLFDDYSNMELDEIFGKGWSFAKLMELKPAEAKAKIEAWKKSREEIRVGDVVYTEDDPDTLGVAMRIEPNSAYILWQDGSCGENKINMPNMGLKSTGRNIDIQNILELIGGVV